MELSMDIHSKLPALPPMPLRPVPLKAEQVISGVESVATEFAPVDQPSGNAPSKSAEQEYYSRAEASNRAETRLYEQEMSTKDAIEKRVASGTGPTSNSPQSAAREYLSVETKVKNTRDPELKIDEVV
jgi:hypothetical protein